MPPDWRLQQLAQTSANFGFLLDAEPLLVSYGAAAEAYVFDDPNASMVKPASSARRSRTRCSSDSDSLVHRCSRLAEWFHRAVTGKQAHGEYAELSGANVLTRQKLDRPTNGYYSAEVFDLLTFTERAPAGTRWDTRESPPVRDVPARPQL